MFSTLLLALASSALASPVLLRRDEATVDSDVATLIGQVQNLTTSVNKLGNIDPFGALALLGPAGKITQQIKQTTSDLSASGMFDPLTSADVADTFIDLLDPLNGLISALETAQPKIKAAGLGFINSDGLVLTQLQNDQTATASLISALQGSLDQSFAAAIPAIGNLINSEFATAIADYQPAATGSSSSGGSGGMGGMPM